MLSSSAHVHVALMVSYHPITPFLPDTPCTGWHRSGRGTFLHGYTICISKHLSMPKTSRFGHYWITFSKDSIQENRKTRRYKMNKTTWPKVWPSLNHHTHLWFFSKPLLQIWKPTIVWNAFVLCSVTASLHSMTAWRHEAKELECPGQSPDPWKPLG